MKVRKMIRWGICLVGVIIMLSGLTGCIRTEKGLEKQFNKDKKFNARLEQELEQYYEEEFEVLYHKAQMEPASFFKMQTYAVCVPKVAPDLEFRVWYDAKTKEFLSCTYLNQMGDYAIQTYVQEIADSLFKEEHMVLGVATYNGKVSSKAFTWQDLKEKQDAIDLSVGVCVAVYGNYDDEYLIEKCLKLWEEVRRDFKECYSLAVKVFPINAERVKGRKMRGQHDWDRVAIIQSREAYKETISREYIEIAENEWIGEEVEGEK